MTVTPQTHIVRHMYSKTTQCKAGDRHGGYNEGAEWRLRLSPPRSVEGMVGEGFGWSPLGAWGSIAGII